MLIIRRITFLLALVLALTNTALAEDSDLELAKKLTNPLSSLISVPLQYNYDKGFGPNDDGSRSVLNIQPIWPFSLNSDWNLVTRTIIPIVDQQDIPVKGENKSGLGDILQSFFFSPKEPVGGWILGAGPVFLYPSASDSLLGGEKWGVGPTAVALQQVNGWTYGMMANHIESFAGKEDRTYISSTFLQPFIAYTTKTKTTIGLNTESTYDWHNSTWSVPVNFSVAQLFRIGKLPMQLTAGVRYWAESPEFGPEGFGARLVLTFLFPK
ncbi:MAG: transporter [Deltaproteobacteria bacterium]|nr:transporter [Deltaproteobacteria bacterium]